MNEGNGYKALQEHLLEELRSLKSKIDTLSEKLAETNLEISKASGLKHTVNDIKEWKSNIEQVVTPSDLHEMKEDIEQLKSHRTQMITIGSIVVFIITLVNLGVAFYSAAKN